MTREEAIKMFRKEIECLSHSRCEDCILEKACDPMKTPFDSEYIEAYEISIKALEQEQARWIPVSERLPDKATRVLTSWVYVPTGAKYIEVAERWGDDDDYTFYGDTDEYKMNRKDHKVIAWMPLPQPYKAESEEV